MNMKDNNPMIQHINSLYRCGRYSVEGSMDEGGDTHPYLTGENSSQLPKVDDDNDNNNSNNIIITIIKKTNLL